MRKVGVRFGVVALGVLVAAVSAAPALANEPLVDPIAGGGGSEADAALSASFVGAPASHDGSRRFSFEIRFSRDYHGLRLATLRDSLTVTGGRLIDVKRTVRGSNSGVTVRVRPASTADVVVTLAAAVAGGGSLTVPGPAPATPTTTTAPAPTTTVAPPAALTASFHGAPDSHDGSRRLSLELRFSEEIAGLRLTALRRALEIDGGRLIDLRRKPSGQNQIIEVRVRPASAGSALTLDLPATTDCAAADAICTRDGRKLSAAASVIITPPLPPPEAVTFVEGLPLDAPSSLKGTAPLISQASIMVSGSAPSHFPATAVNWEINMNQMGRWQAWEKLGMTPPASAVDLQVRERMDGGGHWFIQVPCEVSNEIVICAPGMDGQTRPGEDGNASALVRNGEGIEIVKRWYTYPHNAATNDMKGHLRVHRARWWGAAIGKNFLQRFFKPHGHFDRFWLDYTGTVEGVNVGGDPFVAEAHLEAPGSDVLPTVALNTTVTWTGKAIALSTPRELYWRGDLIGGTALLRLTRTSSTEVKAVLVLTDMKSANHANDSNNVPFGYSGLISGAMTLDSSGNFSQTASSNCASNCASISGEFRGTGGDKVGGVFEIKLGGPWGTYKGVFIAD